MCTFCGHAIFHLTCNLLLSFFMSILHVLGMHIFSSLIAKTKRNVLALAVPFQRVDVHLFNAYVVKPLKWESKLKFIAVTPSIGTYCPIMAKL